MSTGLISRKLAPASWSSCNLASEGVESSRAPHEHFVRTAPARVQLLPGTSLGRVHLHAHPRPASFVTISRPQVPSRRLDPDISNYPLVAHLKASRSPSPSIARRGHAGAFGLEHVRTNKFANHAWKDTVVHRRPERPSGRSRSRAVSSDEDEAQLKTQLQETGKLLQGRESCLKDLKERIDQASRVSQLG